MVEKSQLEKEFEELYTNHIEEINEKLEQASKLLAEAEEIADKYGIPFLSSISPVGQSYIPQSAVSKFKGLDSDFIATVSGVYYDTDYDYYEGWQHSAVC